MFDEYKNVVFIETVLVPSPMIASYDVRNVGTTATYPVDVADDLIKSGVAEEVKGDD